METIILDDGLKSKLTRSDSIIEIASCKVNDHVISISDFSLIWDESIKLLHLYINLENNMVVFTDKEVIEEISWWSKDEVKLISIVPGDDPIELCTKRNMFKLQFPQTTKASFQNYHRDPDLIFLENQGCGFGKNICVDQSEGNYYPVTKASYYRYYSILGTEGTNEPIDSLGNIKTNYDKYTYSYRDFKVLCSDIQNQINPPTRFDLNTDGGKVRLHGSIVREIYEKGTKIGEETIQLENLDSWVIDVIDKNENIFSIDGLNFVYTSPTVSEGCYAIIQGTFYYLDESGVVKTLQSSQIKLTFDPLAGYFTDDLKTDYAEKEEGTWKETRVLNIGWQIGDNKSFTITSREMGISSEDIDITYENETKFNEYFNLNKITSTDDKGVLTLEVKISARKENATGEWLPRDLNTDMPYLLTITVGSNIVELYVVQEPKTIDLELYTYYPSAGFVRSGLRKIEEGGYALIPRNEKRITVSPQTKDSLGDTKYYLACIGEGEQNISLSKESDEITKYDTNPIGTGQYSFLVNIEGDVEKPDTYKNKELGRIEVYAVSGKDTNSTYIQELAQNSRYRWREAIVLSRVSAGVRWQGVKPEVKFTTESKYLITSSGVTIPKVDGRHFKVYSTVPVKLYVETANNSGISITNGAYDSTRPQELEVSKLYDKIDTKQTGVDFYVYLDDVSSKLIGENETTVGSIKAKLNDPDYSDGEDVSGEIKIKFKSDSPTIKPGDLKLIDWKIEGDDILNTVKSYSYYKFGSDYVIIVPNNKTALINNTYITSIENNLYLFTPNNLSVEKSSLPVFSGDRAESSTLYDGSLGRYPYVKHTTRLTNKDTTLIYPVSGDGWLVVLPKDDTPSDPENWGNFKIDADGVFIKALDFYNKNQYKENVFYIAAGGQNITANVYNNSYTGGNRTLIGEYEGYAQKTGESTYDFKKKVDIYLPFKSSGKYNYSFDIKSNYPIFQNQELNDFSNSYIWIIDGNVSTGSITYGEMFSKNVSGSGIYKHIVKYTYKYGTIQNKTEYSANVTYIDSDSSKNFNSKKDEYIKEGYILHTYTEEVVEMDRLVPVTIYDPESTEGEKKEDATIFRNSRSGAIFSESKLKFWYGGKDNSNNLYTYKFELELTYKEDAVKDLSSIQVCKFPFKIAAEDILSADKGKDTTTRIIPKPLVDIICPPIEFEFNFFQLGKNEIKFKENSAPYVFSSGISANGNDSGSFTIGHEGAGIPEIDTDPTSSTYWFKKLSTTTDNVEFQEMAEEGGIHVIKVKISPIGSGVFSLDEFSVYNSLLSNKPEGSTETRTKETKVDFALTTTTATVQEKTQNFTHSYKQYYFSQGLLFKYGNCEPKVAIGIIEDEDKFVINVPYDKETVDIYLVPVFLNEKITGTTRFDTDLNNISITSVDGSSKKLQSSFVTLDDDKDTFQLVLPKNTQAGVEHIYKFTATLTTGNNTTSFPIIIKTGTNRGECIDSEGESVENYYLDWNWKNADGDSSWLFKFNKERSDETLLSGWTMSDSNISLKKEKSEGFFTDIYKFSYINLPVPNTKNPNLVQNPYIESVSGEKFTFNISVGFLGLCFEGYNKGEYEIGTSDNPVKNDINYPFTIWMTDLENKNKFKTPETDLLDWDGVNYSVEFPAGVSGYTEEQVKANYNVLITEGTSERKFKIATKPAKGFEESVPVIISIPIKIGGIDETLKINAKLGEE